MELVFICPHKAAVFRTRHYEIVENKGVRTDEGGHKTLDAKVALIEPCPLCGEKHVYAADALACPFGD